jgi:serine/threonine protein kinase
MNTTLEAGSLLHKRYEIIKLLGRGDFGVVYQAHDKRAVKTNQFVALKQMPAQMIIDCERQADLRANLVHTNIPRILGYFMTDEHSYLVQEFIDGSNLETVLETQPGFLSEKRVITWAVQLCDALDFLHNHPDHPMIFRDLKPNNIMVDHADRIYLVDFGLARVYPPRFFQEKQARFKHLRKGLAIGTAGYSPPEQYRGFLKPQSDIYALGATLHHLLTRRDPRKERPFTFQEYPLRALNPAVSPALEVIVMKALNRAMAERFLTAKEMQTALERLQLPASIPSAPGRQPGSDQVGPLWR